MMQSIGPAKRFMGRVAIITGAARGQGAAEARLFAADGARVVLTDLSDEVPAVARDLGDAALYLRHDVSKSGDWAGVVGTTLEKFGRLDILINNAGVYQPRSLEDTDEELFDLHYRVNQLGTYLGMRAVVAPMSKAGRGAIVNVSSVAGLVGAPGMFAYAASKWAVRGMSRCASAELAPRGIRVNSIHPGVIDTPMLAANSPEINRAFLSGTPLGRLGKPEEVAALAAFLASDEAAFISGAEMTIDGGARP